MYLYFSRASEFILSISTFISSLVVYFLYIFRHSCRPETSEYLTACSYNFITSAENFGPDVLSSIMSSLDTGILVLAGRDTLHSYLTGIEVGSSRKTTATSPTKMINLLGPRVTAM